MNRSIALSVALAVLVAHGFALHGDGEGGLAAPYERAYAAFRLARNLVHGDSLAWLPGTSGIDAYPSLLWVWICALGERSYLGLNPYTQAVGVLFGLGTVIVASRFHPDRAASLIAPLLLAISGGLAAAGPSGLETTLTAFLLTAAFLAFERGWSLATGLALLALGYCRPEGWLLALAFAILRALPPGRSAPTRPATDPDSSRPPPRVAATAFLLPAVGFALLALLRRARTGALLGPDLAGLLVLEPEELAAAAGSLWDFLRAAASPALLAYALWYLARGRLSSTGARALVLGCLWIALIALQGGGHLPFYQDFAPALPLILIASQEGMITALNSTRRPIRGLAWCTFLGAVTLSALTSRSPADLGPLALGDVQRSWLAPSERPGFGQAASVAALGREALEEELRVTRHLRSVGIFLRDHLPPDSVLAAPWPGAVGYLSRLGVQDVLGRVTPLSPGAPLRPWSAPRHVDLTAPLSLRPGHVLATLESGLRAPTPSSLAAEWLMHFDVGPHDEDRLETLRALLAEYQLVTVPIAGVERGQIPSDDERAYLLRRPELGLAPTLELAIEEGSVAVRMRHEGYLQLAELRVRGRDPAGLEWHLTPTGRFVREPALARAHLLVHATGERAVELIRVPLGGEGPELVELEALLVNPGAPSRPQAFGPVSNEATLDLR